MVAHDPVTGESRYPTKMNADGTSPEPHIGTSYDTRKKPQAVDGGFVRGGTTNPSAGQSGEVERLAPDGKVLRKGQGSTAKRELADGKPDDDALAVEVGGDPLGSWDDPNVRKANTDDDGRSTSKKASK